MQFPPPPPPPAVLATRQAPPPGDCSGCRDATDAVLDRRTRNRRRFRAYADASDPVSRLHWRNRLVEDNLPLVYAVAGRQGADAGLPFDDLAQVGSLGLIKAVEAFDPGRDVSFSSFAVPYIQGAMRRERRDRQPMVRPPRPLWDLHQQVLSLQEAQRRRGLAPLPAAALADRLACDPGRLAEAMEVRSATRVRSLDAPVVQAGGEGEAGSCLLDRLAAPAPATPPDAAANDLSAGNTAMEAGGDAGGAESLWLRQQLDGLDPQERQLLVGRIEVGCTWVELGEQLGIPPRQAQRRCDAALARLRSAAHAWRERSLNPSPASEPAPERSPAGPPAASAAR